MTGAPPAQRRMSVAASYVVLSSVLASISMILTGFRFGVGNNIFHIPYVLRLSETPAFTGDAFYGSLKNFTSVVWPLLRLVCNESDVRQVFLCADFLGRAGAFGGLLLLFRSFGLKSWPAMIFCLTIVALSPWFQNDSVVGGHGMFISYFTQTETTWGFVFVSVALLARARLPWSFAMTGIAFSINAFVGIWLLAANSLTLIFTRRWISIRAVAQSLLAFLVFAAPVAIWIAWAVHEPDAVVRFSYISFIRQYYPYHFLIEAATRVSLSRFALLFVMGLVAALHAPDRRFWLTIQVSLMMVFLVGVPLPYVLNARFVFNLHLLRSAGLEQAFAVFLAVAAAARGLFAAPDRESQMLGLIAALALILLGQGLIGLFLVIASLAVLLSRTGDHGAKSALWWNVIGRHSGRLAWVCAAVFAVAFVKLIAEPHFAAWQLCAVALVAVTFGVLELRHASRTTRQAILALTFLCFASVAAARSAIWPQLARAPNRLDSADGDMNWHRFVQQVRDSDFQGDFLVPLGDEFESFQLKARKVAWVGWEEGAAVMWSPAFYNQWMPRYAAVLKLHTPQDFVSYARANGLHNVVLKTATGDCPAPSIAAIRAQPYLLCRL